MKKVLALVVAFALCFTAVAGCFAVSATAPVISIEVADTSFDISGTNYTVKIAQITELTVQNGLAVVDIYNGETKLVEYKPELDDEDDPDFDWVRSTDEDGNTVIKFLNVIKADESFTYTVNVDVENAQPGDYAITATIEAGDYEAEEIIDVADASATFTVEAPHTCAPYGDAVVENKVDATCTTDGSYDSVVYCSCGKVYSSEKVTVPATGHTVADPVVENEVAATCTTDGSYDTVVYCSVCEAEVSRTTVPVPATGHNYGTPVDNGDGTHTATCANNCGIPATAEHSYTDGECACGKKESLVDENISCTFGGVLSSTAGISFMFTNTELPANAKNFELVVTKKTNDDSMNFVDDEVVIPYTNDGVNSIGYGNYKYFYCYGIEMFSFTVPVKAVLKCMDESNNVVATSKEFSITMVEALEINFERADKSNNAKVKTAIADCIIAAEESQKFVTNGLGSCDYATKAALPTKCINLIDLDCATKTLGELSVYDNSDNGSKTLGIGAGIKAAPFLSYNVKPIAAADYANYYVKISYYDVLANGGKGATVSKNIYLNDKDALGTSPRYVYFYDLAIYATNQKVTAELYSVDSAEAISTYSYSFDAFISARGLESSPTYTPVVAPALVALGKLGQSFRAMNGK